MTEERPAGVRERNLMIDWLRVLGICAVLVIHICEVFNPWDEWHVSNPQRSRLAGEVVVLFAPWIMPLLMVLAGWSSWYALERRTTSRFVRERVWRLAVPLVIGTPVFVLPQVYLERRLRGQFDGSIVAFVPHFFEGIYPRGNLSWHHLWFLAHLLVYSLVALPLFLHWRTARGRVALRRVARWCSGSFGLFWLAAPLVLERHVLWWVLPSKAALTVDWANHSILLVAYVYGYMLAAEPRLVADVDRQWRNAALFAGAMSAGLWAMAWRGLLPDGIPAPYSTGYLAFWSIYGVGAWAWVIGIVGFARRRRWGAGPLYRWARDGSYAWYLVHQPVVVAAAVIVIPLEMPLGAKIAAVGTLSVAGTLAVTLLLERFPATRVLLGMPPHEKSGAAPTSPALRGSTATR
ncbi:MAG TPA: acyltransferase [Gemmatimonadaceae bacterium]|nr:acyltransferase [Gemmatimonadaceae bacterium]